MRLRDDNERYGNATGQLLDAGPHLSMFLGSLAIGVERGIYPRDGIGM